MAKYSTITQVIQESDQTQSLSVRAEEFVASLQKLLAQRKQIWHPPTLSNNEIDNSIEISWWRANKSLIFTVETNAPISYLKVWGPNIHEQMEEGVNLSPTNLLALWQWLYA